jgi:transposase-like protein
MAIVWPCPLSVDEYLAAGRELEVPRPECPGCSTPMGFWSGYERSLRAGGRDLRLWVRRARCRTCESTHALLPAFVVAGRLDTVETIGAVLEELAHGPRGVRPAAEAAAVPHTTAREWWRRFRQRAERLAVAFCALVADLGDGTVAVGHGSVRRALDALAEAFRAACSLPGWQVLGRWRFANAVTGGRFLATNSDSPYLVVGRRRFMAPVP